MFLPVLLVRDYGVWGWAVFALPNVLGAAAMGWILKDADASRRIVQSHRPACAAFSIVTLFFQCFFIAWIGARLLSPLAAAGLLLALSILAVVSARRPLASAAVALLASASLAAVGFSRGDFPNIPPAHLLPQTDLLWLSLVCLLGFSLCPYLDLTFHLARQSTAPAAGRAAFSVGFGAFFLAMIFFTLAYAGWLRPDHPSLPLIVAAMLIPHFVIQCALTTGLHARAARPSAPIRYWIAPLLLVCAAGFFADHWRYHNHPGGEIIYRLFLAFYALVSPAYVWTCMVPARPSPRAFAFAVLFAAPFYWMGFIEGHMPWLAAGVFIVAAAGEFSRRAAPRARQIDPA
jgi:hypothetical protein